MDFYVESNEEGHGGVHVSFGEDELGCHTNFQTKSIGKSKWPCIRLQ